jgi:hypothetical protein
MGLRVELAQGEAAAGEEPDPSGIGQEPVVTDADEAFWEDVEEEAATELAEGKREGPGSLAAVVLVAKGDGVVIDGHEPMVGDRDAVGVAGQILEHRVGALERGLGIDDPFGATCLLEKAAERRRWAISDEGAVQFKATLREGVPKARHELAPKQPAQHANRQEEPGPARVPTPVLGQTSSRHDAVDVRMMDECLAPGMEDSEEAETGAEMLRVVGDLLKRLGHRPK